MPPARPTALSLALALTLAACSQPPARVPVNDLGVDAAPTFGADASSTPADDGLEAVDDMSANDASEQTDAGTDLASTDLGSDTDVGSRDRCSPAIGLVEPPEPCTPENPCTNLAPADDATRAERPVDVPTCATSASAIADGRPVFDDGAPRTWDAPSGLTRTWCVYVPPGADADNPLPALVFLHGTAGLASDLYNFTSLRQKAEADGFIVVSLQGRNLHVPTIGRTDSSKWDEYHRDLGSPSSNPDIAFIDHVVDSLDAADPNRIHISGWSNGGFMAQLYAIARHETATPGGRNIASAAVYSAGDPFNHIVAIDDACRLDPYPESDVPIMVVSRSCDLIACDEAQAQSLRTEGVDVPPGRVVESWVADATTEVGATIQWRRVSGLFEVAGRVVDQCSANCPGTRAAINHIRWPDGVADESGRDHEPAMLQFLADHPL